MSQLRWERLDEVVAPVARLLESWGATMVSDTADVVAGDRALLQEWAIARLPPDEMLDIDVAHARPTVGVVHASGIAIVPDEDFVSSSTTGPTVRKILTLATRRRGVAVDIDNDLEVEPGLLVRGLTRDESLAIRSLRRVMDSVKMSRIEDFAGSASYMGSKRELLPFIFGALCGWAPDSRHFVDLMTGSGVVAGRAAQQWPTSASDAQAFSRVLASAQGRGMSIDRAHEVMDRIRPAFAENVDLLSDSVKALLNTERELLRSTLPADKLAPKYARFVRDTPRYPETSSSGLWDPIAEVERRTNGCAKTVPYCLMTAYYANVYFGVEQAVQIDSLRFAIDQLESSNDRDFANASLVVAVSQVASAYGGHFAQPWATPKRVGTIAGFAATVKRRTRSVVQEFEARLYALASRSSRVPYAVDAVVGPWRRAIGDLATRGLDGPVLVYLDAPYKRDEYSRYYHVLETLVNYGYPVVPKGSLLPERGVLGGRFASEFSTRSKGEVANRLAEVVDAALGRGWRVAWSYSDDGDVAVRDVIDRVRGASTCSIVSMRHRYKRQGKLSEPRRVLEFLILFEPDELTS